jgi:hypothetical protein
MSAPAGPPAARRWYPEGRVDARRAGGVGEILIHQRVALDHGRGRGGGVHARAAILGAMGNAERIIYIGRRAPDRSAGLQPIAIGGAGRRQRAFALAKKAGVDAARVRQALLGGFAAAASSKSRRADAHRQLQAGFRARLYQKDLSYERGGGGQRGRDPATAIVTQLMINALIASGGADLDYAALGQCC